MKGGEGKIGKVEYCDQVMYDVLLYICGCVHCHTPHHYPQLGLSPQCLAFDCTVTAK